MLYVKVRAFVLQLSMLEVLILAQTLQENSLDDQSLHNGACDLMLVSYAETIEGKAVLIEGVFVEIWLLQVLVGQLSSFKISENC